MAQPTQSPVIDSIPFLAIVNNPADQWPLYSTIIIALGLTIVFSEQLIRYLWRQSKIVQVGRIAGSEPRGRRISRRWRARSCFPAAPSAAASSLAQLLVLPERYDPEIIRMVAELPVQEGDLAFTCDVQRLFAAALKRFAFVQNASWPSP